MTVERVHAHFDYGKNGMNELRIYFFVQFSNDSKKKKNTSESVKFDEFLLEAIWSTRHEHGSHKLDVNENIKSEKTYTFYINVYVSAN